MLAPGLRLGWIIAAEYIVDQLALIKQRGTLFTEGLGQLVMAEFIRSGAYDKHLLVVQKEHRERRDALMKAMHEWLPRNLLSGARSAGGIYFWGRLGGGIKGGELLQKAIAAGVSFAHGEIFYPDGAGSEHVRLCFGTVPVERIEEGINRLAKCLKVAGSAPSNPQEQKLPIV